MCGWCGVRVILGDWWVMMFWDIVGVVIVRCLCWCGSNLVRFSSITKASLSATSIVLSRNFFVKSMVCKVIWCLSILLVLCWWLVMCIKVVVILRCFKCGRARISVRRAASKISICVMKSKLSWLRKSKCWFWMCLWLKLMCWMWKWSKLVMIWRCFWRIFNCNTKRVRRRRTKSSRSFFWRLVFCVLFNVLLKFWRMSFNCCVI